MQRSARQPATAPPVCANFWRCSWVCDAIMAVVCSREYRGSRPHAQRQPTSEPGCFRCMPACLVLHLSQQPAACSQQAGSLSDYSTMHLQRLAQPHVVCQHAVQPKAAQEGQPVDALLLVAPQGAGNPAAAAVTMTTGAAVSGISAGSTRMRSQQPPHQAAASPTCRHTSAD